jgi:hypothetical protein
MGSEIQQPERKGNASQSAEVEFALVLSRMIDSLESDPEHLRATVYELARYKLQEQLLGEDAANAQRLSTSLEVAIQGVENFAAKDNHHAAWIERQTLARPTPPVLAVMSALKGGSTPLQSELVEEPQAETKRRFATPGQKSKYTAALRFAIIPIIALAIGIALKQHVIEIGAVQKEKPAEEGGQNRNETSSFGERAAEFDSLKPASPLLPTTYGVFAVSGDKLYRLDLLMGRAPDIRVAISAAILTPSGTTLPDGHVKFIVYRRDSGTSAADRAEVRVVAKITREMSFDKAGAPAVVPKPENTWVLRNISIPLQTAPKKDNPDMYEIQSENPENELTPGRYALVLKGQAYDFSVAGTITDPKQCLEQLAATNGTFYSECRKL